MRALASFFLLILSLAWVGSEVDRLETRLNELEAHVTWVEVFAKTADSSPSAKEKLALELEAAIPKDPYPGLELCAGLLAFELGQGEAGLSQIAREPGSLAQSLVAYLKKTPPPSEAPEDTFAQVLDAGSFLAREDLDQAEARLKAIPERFRRDFHPQLLLFLTEVLRGLEDPIQIEARLDALQEASTRPSSYPHLGRGPDAFAWALEPDGAAGLRLRRGAFQAALLEEKDSRRRFRVRNLLSQAALASVLGKTKRSVQKAEILHKNHRQAVAEDGFPDLLESLLYPQRYLSLVQEAARTHGVDPALILAVIWEESRFSPDAGSGAGARGLMQLMPATADWIRLQRRGKKLKPGEILEPKVNIDLGTWYLAYLEKLFRTPKDPLPWTLAAYNAGPGNATRWLKTWKKSRSVDSTVTLAQIVDYPETRAYLDRVQGALEVYRKRLSPKG